MDGGGFRPRAATKPFASETRVLLREIGLGHAEVEDLLARNITRAANGHDEGEQ